MSSPDFGSDTDQWENRDGNRATTPQHNYERIKGSGGPVGICTIIGLERIFRDVYFLIFHRI